MARSIATSPPISGYMQALVARAQQISPVPFGVYPSGGARTKEQQAALTRAGWSKTMHGAHMAGNAIDLIPIVNGVPDPNNKTGYGLIHDAMMQASNDLGIPIKAGADYKGNFKDPPHYELAGDMPPTLMPAQGASARGQGSGAPVPIPFTAAENYELGKAGYPGVAAPSEQELFSSLEGQYGLPAGTLGGFYGIESNYGKNAGVSSAGAQGPFQFIPSTARQYGLSNPQSLAASAEATARYASDNAQELRQALGREPTAGELYLAHQQGAAGAIALLSNPDVPAAQAVGGYARIAQNLPADMRAKASTMTAGDFANYWTGQFGDKAMAFSPGMQIDSPGMQAVNAMAGGSVPPTTVADITAPPAVPAGPGSNVIAASMAGDPDHLTKAWNDLVTSAVTGGAAAGNKISQYFAGLNQPMKVASAAPFAFNPDLWNAVPKTALPFGMGPEIRAPMQKAADEILTGGHAAEQMKSLGIGPSVVYDTRPTPSPAEKPATYQGGPMAGADIPAPTKDPLQAINIGAGLSAGSMATTPPVTPPALDESMSYAMGSTPDITFPLHLDAPAAVAPMAYAPPPPMAAPPKQTAPSIATSAPKYVSGEGRLGKLYNAIAAPIRPGSANFWNGPMVQPFFTPGGGGATMPYQSNTGMSTTDVHGNKVNLGVYTDTNGNQHTYELG